MHLEQNNNITMTRPSALTLVLARALLAAASRHEDALALPLRPEVLAALGRPHGCFLALGVSIEFV